MLDKVEVGKLYRNKKNKQIYEVNFIGRYTEKPMEKELMVGYIACYPSENPYWVRPFNLFLEKFEEIN